MIDSAQKRGEIIRNLEHALDLADVLQDGATGYLIERALDEARGRLSCGVKCRGAIILPYGIADAAGGHLLHGWAQGLETAF